jgi:colanic acid/amylovoran biosynthesis glycosyltransferase
MKKKVLVYNDSFFEISETFIYRQVNFLQDYFDLYLAGHHLKNQQHFPLQHPERVQVIEDKDAFPWNFITKVKRKTGYPAAMGHRAGKQLHELIQRQQFDLVHVHFGYTAVKALPILKKFNVPVIVSFHGYDASGMAYANPSYLNALPELIERASKLIIVSEHMKEIIGANGRHSNKVILYPYSVDVQQFESFSTRSGNQENFHILHSGRLVGKKGVPDLVTVFSKLSKQYPHLVLHILGDGPEAGQTHAIVNENGLKEKVIFYGSQPNQKVKELMQQADIFVLNSRTADNGDMEGLPVTILEAMSMGKAIVSTRHAGIPFAIRDQHNGLLVEEKNNEQLYAAMEKLILNADLRRQLGQNARTIAEQQFDMAVLGPQLAAIYNQAIEGL